MFKKLLLSVLIVFAGTHNAAIAKTIKSEVKAGKTTLIYNYAQYDPERCSGMAVPKVGTVKAKNGKITTRTGTQNIDSGVCKGRKIKAVEIYYTPNRSFRGKDKASVVLLLPIWVDGTGHKASKLNFNLDIK